MSQEERSEALIDVLADLERSTIDFVLVGGYAVSQFETRFSTDLDLVIASEDTDAVVTFLEEQNFERKNDLEVPPEETIYNREIELFERTAGLPHPVGVDLLVNGLGCRQTEAEWSFDYLRDHCSETTISGGTRSTTVPLLTVKSWSLPSSIVAERPIWPTFLLPFRTSTFQRWHHISIAATKTHSTPSSERHRSSSRAAGWITDSRACSVNHRRRPTTWRPYSNSSMNSSSDRSDT